MIKNVCVWCVISRTVTCRSRYVLLAEVCSADTDAYVNN